MYIVCIIAVIVDIYIVKSVCALLQMREMTIMSNSNYFLAIRSESGKEQHAQSEFYEDYSLQVR
jgi:hypothetical protein